MAEASGPDVRRFDDRSAVSALVELVETTAQGRPDVLAWYLGSLLGGLEVRAVEADRVSGAEVVALPGPDHGWGVDPQEITREIERFLTKLGRTATGTSTSPSVSSRLGGRDS